MRLTPCRTLRVSCLAANLVDGLPNGGHDQLLVVGKQQDQRGRGRRVTVARPPSTRLTLDRAIDEARSHHFVELLGYRGTRNASLAG